MKTRKTSPLVHIPTTLNPRVPIPTPILQLLDQIRSLPVPTPQDLLLTLSPMLIS